MVGVHKDKHAEVHGYWCPGGGHELLDLQAKMAKGTMNLEFQC